MNTCLMRVDRILGKGGLRCCSIWQDSYQTRGGVNSFFKRLFAVLIKTDIIKINYWIRARTITINESKRQIYVK